jgi:radical SAM protein with 4Fe4S-binding SPASM domain
LISHDELRETFTRAAETAAKLELTVTSNVCTPFCVLNPADYPNIAFGSCSPEVKRRPLTIDLNGNLRLCNDSPVIAGNIFKEKLQNILDSPYVHDWVRMRPDVCSKCELWEKCLGGCRAASEQLGKSLKYADPLLDNKVETGS